MTRTRKIALFLGILLFLLLVLPFGGFYWRAHRALPGYEGEIRLAGLSQPVRIARDARAVPHLQAQSLEDLLFAQGFVHAQERLWQMDLQRRVARGRLAEIFGSAALPLDKENRVLGLGSVADRAYESMEPAERAPLDAYARGVNAFMEERGGSPLFSRLPIEFALLRYRPEPWKPADSLTIVLNMFKLLTHGWRAELARARVEALLDPERAADLFVSSSEFDHPIAEPIKPRPRPPYVRVFVAGDCRHSWQEILGASHWLPAPCADGCAASNNWVVAGNHTASGFPLLANDTHLPHSVPSVWFINHLTAPELDVAGFSLPGIPLVVLGHNRHIAWGTTNSMADVQDLFIEQSDPDDPSRYLAPGGWQAVQVRVEHIQVRGSDEVELEVKETRHGPVVHEDGPMQLALQWTARDITQFSFPLLALNQARNWEGFKAALAQWGAPPQNFVYADREGHIGFHVAGRIPVRRNGQGQVPMPGQTDEYEWVDYVPFEDLPSAFDPPEGVLATANNRVVPRGYPYHLTDRWIGPARVRRIYQVLTAAIEEGSKLTREDFLQLQGDVLSLPDRFLAEQIKAAGATLAAHPQPRSQALALLAEWDGQMRSGSPAPLLVSVTRNHLMEALLKPHLNEEWRSYSWFMSSVFLENVLRDRPERWLPSAYSSYDKLLLASLDAAIEDIRRQTRAPALERLRWGEHMRVRIAHPVGDRLPLLRRCFSVGGPPQSGGSYTVKQTGRSFGPSQRLVVDFGGLDETWMNITLGQSGHVASPHYKDQFPSWLAVRSFPAPFSDQAVERAARHIQQLLPAESSTSK